MTRKTITRADLCEAVYQKVGLSRTESAALVELVLKEITDCLERGETVKLSSFGSFVVRKKGQRIGRNPKTGKEVPISPRRVMVFKPSAILKQRINSGPDGTESQVAQRYLSAQGRVLEAGMRIAALRLDERGDEGLIEHLLERHLGEERDHARDEGGIAGALDDHGEAHGGRFHLDGRLGALVLGAVDDVGPVDELGEAAGVVVELRLRDVGDEAGAGDVVGIVEVAQGFGAVGLAGLEVLLVFGGEEGAEMVVEPPGDARRG